jgi:hypothetical protein
MPFLLQNEMFKGDSYSNIAAVYKRKYIIAFNL